MMRQKVTWKMIDEDFSGNCVDTFNESATSLACNKGWIVRLCYCEAIVLTVNKVPKCASFSALYC